MTVCLFVVVVGRIVAGFLLCFFGLFFVVDAAVVALFVFDFVFSIILSLLPVTWAAAHSLRRIVSNSLIHISCHTSLQV